jgi:hypothetical protein
MPGGHTYSGILALVFVLACYGRSLGYRDWTHEAVNVGAGAASTLDFMLAAELTLTKGTEEVVSGQRVIDWIREAGVQEDKDFRFLNHFHQPLRSPWRGAGLNDLRTGSSSVVWGQRTDQEFSWVNARTAYFESLTEPERVSREKALGLTLRAVGQVMHLMADSAVPAHVRNDQHVLGDPYEKWVEAQAGPRRGERPDEARARFLGGFAAAPVRPDAEFLLAIPILGQNAVDAPVPVARLSDSDLYDGLDASVTATATIGMTEYANANFFSDDTMFGDQQRPGHKHFAPFPRSSDVEMWIDPANKRRYWRKRPGSPGEPIQHLATASKRRTWAEKAGMAPSPRGGLDERVHEEYARRLIPRAVGYSAAVLDYFFRGRLELGFDPAPGDAGGLTLTLINRSPEALGPGTLGVFYDDATGERRPIPGGSIEIQGVIQPDEAIVPALTLGPEATVNPVIAAYRGKLGSEANAVIGKVEDPIQVEEIFRGSTDWMLRTTTGVFPLGLGLAPGRVRWGDRDNTLLVETFLPGRDRRFEAYRIRRPEGSRSVPLKADPIDPPAKMVDLEPWGPPVTLSGADPDTPIDLGTRVTYTRVIDYSQQLLEITGTFRYHYDPTFPVVSFFGTTYGDWVQDFATFVTPAVVKTVYERTFTYSPPPFSLALVLDPRPPTPYHWSLLEAALNGDGDVVGLVEASPAFVPGERVPYRRHTPDGRIEEVAQLYDLVAYDPPLPDLMIFVVNLTKRTVIGKSCADDVTLVYRTTQQTLLADLYYTAADGRLPASELTWINLALAGTPTGSEQIVGEVTTRTGVEEQGLAGLYQGEFARAGLGDMQMRDTTTRRTVTFADPFTLRGAVVASGSLGAAIRLTEASSIPDPFPALIFDARRSSGADEGYTLLGWQLRVERQEWSVFQWSVLGSTLTLLPPLSDVSSAETFGLSIAGANRSTAAVVEDRLDPVASEFVSITHLLTSRGELVFSGDLEESYRLLQPGFLYNVEDLRFHRVDNGLPPLPGPRPLAAGDGAFGEYHVVGLR